MKAFSYTKSPYLVAEIDKIEELRKTLLLTTLSPNEEILFQWNTQIDRIYFTFLLNNKQIARSEIKSLIKTNSLEVSRFKKTLDYLYQQWLVSSETVNVKAFTTLYLLLYGKRANPPEEDLQNSLKYIQTNPDNPLVASALSQILLLTTDYFGPESNLMAPLAGLLFLYKYGYDFRRMLVLEEYYYQHKDRYQGLINRSLRDTNITPWLEFVVEAASYQLNKLLRQISSKDYAQNDSRLVVGLNDRQNSLLRLLDEPGSKISNKIVQKKFKVSPITAARDLAKLVNLGVLFAIGKGRSTYYTKV